TVLSQWAEELPDVVDQQAGLLHGREVAAARHLGPAGDVVVVLGPLPRRIEQLPGEQGAAGRQRHELFGGPEPADPAGLAVEAGRGSERLGHPVDRDVAEQLVPGESPLDVAAPAAPRPELLDDPTGPAR